MSRWVSIALIAVLSGASIAFIAYGVAKLKRFQILIGTVGAMGTTVAIRILHYSNLRLAIHLLCIGIFSYICALIIKKYLTTQV